MQTVTMPNGLKVNNVPEGTTKADLVAKLVAGGRVTQEEADQWLPAATPEPEPEATLTPVTDALEQRLPASMRTPEPLDHDYSWSDLGSDTIDAVKSNADIPGGIAGSIAGAKAGAPFGPLGMAVGTVAGGAAGTFGGSILSDYLTSDGPDFEKATEEALVSAGIDTATLGLAKAVKPIAKLAGIDAPDMFKRVFGIVDETPSAAVDNVAHKVGSEESLQATQELLREGGGSLTAYQTGKASGARNVAEGLAEIGVLSRGTYQKLADTNAKTIGKQVEDLVDHGLASQTDDVGGLVHGVIMGGREANQQLYGQALDEVSQKMGQATVQPRWITGTIEKFRKEGQKSWGSIYDDDTLKVMNEWSRMLKGMDTMPVSDLLALQKKLNADINKLGAFGSGQNTTASRELAELASRVRKTTQMLLDSKNPAGANIYREANEAYSTGMTDILPELNANLVSRATKGDYAAIARALEGSNPDRINAFMKSIDKSYARARQAGIDMMEKGGLESADRVKEVVRTSYLKNLFGEVSADGFDPKQFRNLAARFEKPRFAASAKAILGPEKFASMKRLLNAMAESTEGQGGAIGSLVLRGKEAEGLSTLLQGGLGGGLAAGGPLGLAGAGAVFLGPVFLAKVASNPKAVSRLLNMSKKATPGKGGAAVGSTTEALKELWNMLSEEDQQDIREAL